MARQVHLVGSVGLRDAETVFSTVSAMLGSCCPRIPAGETGERGYWMRWQRNTFALNLGFEEVMTTRSLSGFNDNVARTFCMRGRRRFPSNGGRRRGVQANPDVLLEDAVLHDHVMVWLEEAGLALIVEHDRLAVVGKQLPEARVAGELRAAPAVYDGRIAGSCARLRPDCGD